MVTAQSLLGVLRALAIAASLAATACAGGESAADGSPPDERDGGGGGGGGGGPEVDAAPAVDLVDVEVAGDRAWTDTGLDLTAIELVQIEASGSISFEPGAEVGPEGYGPDDHDGNNVVQCSNHASLIAKIGTDGSPMALGEHGWLAATRAGRLFLGPNDRGTGNNSGSFSVRLTPDQSFDLVVSQSLVAVSGTSDWVDTGFGLEDYHLLTVAASGQVDNNTDDDTTYGAGGVPDTTGHPASILACANHVALIGRIGADGSPFRVGSDASRPLGRSGRLFLRVNDTSQENNGGDFSAEVSAGKYPR